MRFYSVDLGTACLPCTVWYSLLLQVGQRETSNQYRNLKFAQCVSFTIFWVGKHHKLPARNHPIFIARLCGCAKLCKDILLPPVYFRSGEVETSRRLRALKGKSALEYVVLQWPQSSKVNDQYNTSSKQLQDLSAREEEHVCRYQLAQLQSRDVEE